MKRVLLYIKNVLLAFDILGNALTGGNHLEVMSVRFGRIKHRLGICIFLNLFEKDHCNKSLLRWRKEVKATYKMILETEKKEFIDFGK